MAQRLKPCPGRGSAGQHHASALAMRCSCHCTKSRPSGSYAVVSAPVKGCEWRVAMSVMSDLCEPVPKQKCPGVPGWAFTASRAAFRAMQQAGAVFGAQRLLHLVHDQHHIHPGFGHQFRVCLRQRGTAGRAQVFNLKARVEAHGPRFSP